VPAVFVCNNNQWAISVPADRQTASASFAAKPEAYGFPGVVVDGMDPLATFEVVSAALDRAKNPGSSSQPDDPSGRARRPTLIEAVQYRFGAHTTADDPTTYRDEETVAAWRNWDPIPRVETFLRERGSLDDEHVDAIETDVRETVAESIERALDVVADPDDLFADAYAEPTPRVEEQRAYLQRLREKHDDEALLDEN
jgi:pyruvate dehydrogenase E1 component alpha subunit